MKERVLSFCSRISYAMNAMFRSPLSSYSGTEAVADGELRSERADRPDQDASDACSACAGTGAPRSGVETQETADASTLRRYGPAPAEGGV